ncbi:hypothetical protein Kpol_1036p63 [Vanderwaltozyma polyspora DSM 70294]|uniref:Uncharacterized protein n=1 Tax=Vanderwaltozyma polyspora (strain ATCC 22028 / DSM 70294 / BCRC 21397 / CBS 2163 / NBRC 10782 / NRRL Y-8283 / UCD 57-17) TaxID=436907 RepID=A7TEL1_VANPO|nr:uncharacterized protein Kpol_1036p63 [Vanderwaltozyma polyspora DSM 70294]EDO19318.1 hypothetical protein Kpol_1036p63 [Vanderwaltozyma polyspora DSM 70294]
MLPTPLVKCDYDKIYEPSEDSFLLLDALEKEQGYLVEKFNGLVLVCEFGPGSGIVTTFMIQNRIPVGLNSVYLAVDVSPWAVEATLETAKLNNCDKGTVLDTVQGNLGTGLRKNQVDVLLFNPPYVPAEEVPEVPESKDDYKWLDLALDGGEDGMVVTQKVLDNLDSILSKNGVAYILFCARNHPEQVAEEMRLKGWKIDLVEHRKAGWEVLSVYRFSRN